MVLKPKQKDDKLAAAVLTPREAALVVASGGGRACVEAALKRKPAFISRLMHDIWDRGSYDSGRRGDKLAKLVADGWEGDTPHAAAAREAFFRQTMPAMKTFIARDCSERRLLLHLREKPEAWFAVAFYTCFEEDAVGEVYLASIQAMIGMGDFCLCDETLLEAA